MASSLVAPSLSLQLKTTLTGSALALKDSASSTEVTSVIAIFFILVPLLLVGVISL
jgi:hypothetical protein